MTVPNPRAFTQKWTEICIAISVKTLTFFFFFFLLLLAQKILSEL